MDKLFDVTIERFIVAPGGASIQCRIDSPANLCENAALVLSLGAGVEQTLGDEDFRVPILPVLEAGHRVISFDLPCHGDRVDEFGLGITGFNNMYEHGIDVFSQVTDECKAVLDAVIEKRMAKAGNIGILGTSRGGYIALRAFAADARIKCASCICPVTGWEYLSEFSANKDKEEVLNLRLDNFAHKMVGRAVHLAIGGHDDRVSTESCLRFYLRLCDENEKKGYSNEGCTLVVTEDKGHNLIPSQVTRCGEILLENLTAKV